MALSAPPPPPPDPAPSSSTTTAVATTSTTTRPPFPPNPRNPPTPPPPPPPPPHFHPHPLHPHHYPAPFYPQPHPHLINSRLPASPNSNYPPPSHDVTTTANATTTLYPVASSGRGFLQKHPHSSVPVNNSINPNSHLYAAGAARPGVGISYPRPLFGYSHPDPGLVAGTGMGMGMGYVSGRSIPHLQHPAGGGATVMPGVIKGVPISASASSQPQHKVSLSSTPVSDSNGHKEMRERGRDDSFVTIRDRKVRVSESASLYAHCRSWLRNGFPEESQPINMDAARSLPRPLPLPAQGNVSPVKKDNPKEEEEFQVEGSVDNLTSEELLQTHIKRAKRVRSRLREERLQRIARYKTRLALLLPLMVEQQMRNDSASGN
ncbi:uncharacterized protein [Coffea arabica]|uniref:Uncharacterized protein isoform X3 n=1 Tax=Coffea arabica TaxID=13443 RepID=A0ABM4WIL1_COFAR